MNIALTAPTGKVGTAFLTAARERRLPVRALLRNSARLRVPVDATVSFDFDDGATYARALEGVDTLVLVSPSTPKQVDVDGAVVDAARGAGVAHVIRLSGAGAEQGGGRFAEQHRAIDRYLGTSRIAATIVRPTFFMENVLGLTAPIAAGTYPAPAADARMGQVAVADIAAVLVAVAADPGAHRGATYTLTGPAAHTGHEIAAALSEAAGHRVRYVDVPEEAFRQNLLRVGLDEWTADGLVEAYRWVRAGGTAAITDDVRRVTGRTPTGFSAWARAHAEALRANTNA
jgi:uncharacterized protein YbjT (DUF2867 family)